MNSNTRTEMVKKGENEKLLTELRKEMKEKR